MEIKYKNESLSFHPDFTFVIGGGAGLGSPCHLQGVHWMYLLLAWLASTGRALEGPRQPCCWGWRTVPCWSLWQSQQWESLVLSRPWHRLASNLLREHRLVLSHSCLPFWSQPFVMLANITISKALHSKEKTNNLSGLTSEPFTHYLGPHLILL